MLEQKPQVGGNTLKQPKRERIELITVCPESLFTVGRTKLHMRHTWQLSPTDWKTTGTPEMKKLSISAQAVLDAAFVPWETIDTPQSIAAAALRAAVKQTRKRKVLKTLWVTMVKGPIYCLEADLLAIADELEGAN